jgi:site-specific DNA recombinase
LKRAGVSIEYVLGEYPDTPEGNLMKHVRASVAEYERLKIIERMVRGRYLKAKSGGILVAKHPPFGYTLELTPDGKKCSLVIHENEAKVVRLIFAWFTISDGTGEPLGTRMIATKLNKLGVPTVSNPIRKTRSRVWACSAIRSILQNETYLGKWHYGKTRRSKKNSRETLVTVQVPDIVDQETWDIAQERIKRGNEKYQRRMTYQYLMSHRLRCGKCGGTLHVNVVYNRTKTRTKVYRYYICEETGTNLVRCRDIRCNIQRVDQTIWEWVKSVLLDTAQLESGLDAYREANAKETAHIQERLQVTDELLADHKDKLNRLLDLYLTGEFQVELLIERKTRLEATIAALEQERIEIAKRVETQVLTSEQVEMLKQFGVQVAQNLNIADEEFPVRREIIELLDVTAALMKEGKEMVLYAHCIVGGRTLWLKDKFNCDNYSNIRPRQWRANRAGFGPLRARRQ